MLRKSGALIPQSSIDCIITFLFTFGFLWFHKKFDTILLVSLTMLVVMGKHDAGYCILGRMRDFNIVTLPFKERFQLNQMFNVSVIICSLGSKLYFWIQLYSLGGLAGNDHGLSTLFVQVRVTPPVNGIEQICNVRVIQWNASKSCLKHKRLLNYAVYDKMTCMLHHHMLANTIIRTKFLKFEVEMRFLLRFW